MGCGPPATEQRQNFGEAGADFSMPVFREPKRQPISAGALENWISGKLKTVIISGCH
jgi:hypothetical protein